MSKCRGQVLLVRMNIRIDREKSLIKMQQPATGQHNQINSLLPLTRVVAAKLIV